MPDPSKNVLGSKLLSCSEVPLTGFYRNGCCDTGEEDAGKHSVCAVMTRAFLDFTRAHGNDLCTPAPWLDFPGLKPGDRWCVCVDRWKEAMLAGCAPPVVLEATHANALDTVTLEELLRHAHSESAPH